MTCPRCHATHPAGVKFCGACGGALDGAAGPAAPSTRRRTASAITAAGRWRRSQVVRYARPPTIARREVSPKGHTLGLYRA